jgi:ADP-ribosylglycohydrolase
MDAVATLRAIYPEESVYRSELEWRVRPDDSSGGTGSGYVVDSLRSARFVVEGHENYEDIVRAAIALGNDTDTTAAVAGGVAGVRAGVAGIPHRWCDGLRGMDLARPLIERLLRHRAGVTAQERQ